MASHRQYAGFVIHPVDPPGPQPHVVPRVPASSGALIFDVRRRLLILKPTYKAGWNLPGGEMEADGETPWEACRREVREECGLEVDAGRLVAVDFRRQRPARPATPERPGRPARPGGLRFLFDCGSLPDDVLAGIVLDPGEIAAYRLVPLPEVLPMLRKGLRRAIRSVLAADAFVYLEDGLPVRGVT